MANLRSAKHNDNMPWSREAVNTPCSSSSMSATSQLSINHLCLVLDGSHLPFLPPLRCKNLAITPQLIPHAYRGPVTLLFPWQRERRESRVRCPVRQGKQKTRGSGVSCQECTVHLIYSMDGQKTAQTDVTSNLGWKTHGFCMFIWAAYSTGRVYLPSCLI